ncbi:MAG: hypothetical protein IAE82_11185 [Opitutaceae bacterium]|nr:hypothetical protein [Opitutaceae bacterium]
MSAADAAPVPVAAAPRVQTPASSDDLDALSDTPLSDESFESATTVVPRSVLAHRDVERGDSTPISELKPPPPLEEMVAKIPAETKDALDQLFRARFRAVRRITPEQLR